MWKEITVAGFKVFAKVYKEGSGLGIPEAPRISKLTIYKHGKALLDYDRGWCFNHLPNFTFKALMTILNHLL